MKKSKTILAIDIDGTLCKELCYTEEECRNATPNHLIIGKVNRLYKMDGIEIVIYSARVNRLKEATLEWLKYWGVKYHRYGPRKMPFDWLVDDRTIRPEDFT
jgi:hypothetical protein